MKDEKQLFDISTSLLENEIDSLVKREDLSPAEVTVILTIMIGRIVGKMGYRHMSSDQYWNEIMKHGKALYKLGYDSERQNES